MNLAEAEGILALEVEISTALKLATSQDEFRDDWRLQLAAERIIERIFQAATALADKHQIGYFGDDGLQYLRGMRNRLAHNYLDIDVDILWNTLAEDIPLVNGLFAVRGERPSVIGVHAAVLAALVSRIRVR